MSVVVETIVVVETVSVVAPPVGIAIAVGVGAIAVGAAIATAFSSSEKPKPKPPPAPSQSTKPPSIQPQKAPVKPKQSEKTSRNKTKEVDDPSSEQVEKSESSEPTTTAVAQHIADRFERFIRFAGIINRISALTENQIDRHEVVDYGRTDVQDASSGLGRDVHAAHVIRAGRRNIRLQQIDRQLYDMLGNIIGHTQNVPRWANEWRGLGGDIDRFQEEFRHIAIDIGYDGELTAESIQALQRLKREYLKILAKWIQKLSDDKEKKAELEKAKEMIEKMTIEGLYEKGKKGRDGDYDPYYMP